jgi:hypothetical protein
MGTTVQVLDYFEQTPDEVLQYTLNVAPWLGTGETIDSATWEVSNATTPPLAASSVIDFPTSVTFFVSGGVHLEKYTLVIEVTTSVGNVKHFGIQFTIRDLTP